MAPLQINRRIPRSLLATATVMLLLPTAVALYLAHQSMLRNQLEGVTLMTTQVYERVTRISTQMEQALATLKAAQLPDPCAPQGTALMRKMLLQNDLLADVGYVQANQLRCSAFGQQALPLGAPTYTSLTGYWLRNAVHLPGAENVPLVTATDPASGYTLFTHPTTALNIVPTNQPWQVVVVGRGQHDVVLAQHGDYSPQWLTHVGTALHGRFVDTGHLVVWRQSPRSAYLVFVALPRATVEPAWRKTALLWGGLGLGTGLVLMLLTLRVAKTNTSIRSLLRRAIRNGELSLEYQPVVELASGRWVGAEALMRWRRPTGETISPSIFIPIAEKAGLMPVLREWLIRRFEQEAALLFALHPGFHVALNFCVEDFCAPSNLVPLLREALERIGATAANVQVELTESVFMRKEDTCATLTALREAGIALAIDDFGTGYSSLSYLSQVRFDYLKIDKSFVETIGTGAVTRHIVAHIIEMAKSLQTPMIAEGVETEAQAHYLRQHGVQYAQGWLYAKSMAIGSLLNHLSEQTEPARKTG